jgi:uncharacterized protein
MSTIGRNPCGKALFLFLSILALFPNLGPVTAWPATAEKLAVISTPTGSKIFAEIAATLDKRTTGLMFRNNLESDRGMLFVFPEMGYWTFWMKNTLIPLDIIWLDDFQRILHVESRVPICTKIDDSCPRYSARRESQYVLEIKAGMAEQLGLEPGQQLKVTIPHNQSGS